jgi:regulatory protein
MTENKLYHTALSKAMALCAGREMCINDIQQKLNSWGIGNNDTGKIINQLIKEKFIDEKRYAFAFVKDKFRYNKWGKVKIASSLRIKKIPDEIITISLDTIDNEEYLEIIKTIIANHRRSVKSKNNYDLKGKLLRFGLSKGFESHLLYDLLNDLY